jgi:hypothetical protein
LNDRDIAVAVVVSGGGTVKDAKRLDLAAVESDDLVAIEGGAPVTIVHELDGLG